MGSLSVLWGKNNFTVKQIQITYAIDGYTEHLRLQQLTKNGSVDALTKPIIYGSGRSKTVVFPSGMPTRHDAIVCDIIQTIRQRIKNKLVKRYTHGIALVVGFNDSCLNTEDTCEFRKAYDVIEHSFLELFLIGIHGKILVPEKISSAPPNGNHRG